jgi:hypothetical protein
MRPWLKAGLIGGGVLALLTILTNLGTLLPSGVSTIISCCLCIPLLLAYPGTGALAAYWLTPPRMAGEGAKEGALAGIIAGVIDGVVSMILALIMGAAGAYQQMLSQLPPETMRALKEMGLATTGGWPPSVASAASAASSGPSRWGPPEGPSWPPPNGINGIHTSLPETL